MKDKIRFFDKFNFATLLLLALIGIALIYSASHTMADKYHLKQATWLLVALFVFFVLQNVKTESIFRIAAIFYILIVAVLLVQLVAGRVIAGTKSWIRMGVIGFQVSEMVKIPLGLLLAKMLLKIKVIDWKVFFKLAALVGIPFILIALQPDVGTATILIAYLIVVVLLKGIRMSVLISVLLIICAGSFLSWNYLLKPYQKDRLVSFVNPDKYSQSTGYQIIQSKIAIGSGGLTGKGFLKGSQSRYHFLPTRHTDFIISVLGEEFGFLGISLLFLLYFLLFTRQVRSKVTSNEEFFFIYLFNGLILFQFLVNVLMSIGLFPILGVPLPFVSYGGSSLLVFFMGEALIFRMKMNPFLT